MNFYIAVFKSRKDAFDFSDALSGRGVRNAIVSTPHRLEASCSLSVKFETRFIGAAQFVLSKRDYSSFKGFFLTD